MLRDVSEFRSFLRLNNNTPSYEFTHLRPAGGLAETEATSTGGPHFPGSLAVRLGPCDRVWTLGFRCGWQGRILRQSQDAGSPAT